MESVFVTLVGTGATAPSVERGLAAQLVQIGGMRLLIDCGEGTQVAIKRHANSSPESIDAIFLTHFHADHWGGIFGLIKTRSRTEGIADLPIYALADGIANLKNILKASHTYSGFELIEIKPNDVIELSDEWEVQVVEALHEVDACSFVFLEKDQPGRFDAEAAIAAGVKAGPDMGTLSRGGTLTLSDGTVVNGNDFIGKPRHGRKLAFSGDTRPTDTFANAAKNANLMVHESTHLTDRQDRAIKTKHSTAGEAMQVAVDANAQELWLTHLSGSTPARAAVLEARAVSKNLMVRAPYDGTQAEIKGDGRVVLVRRDEK